MATRDVVSKLCNDECATIKTDRTLEGATIYLCPGCDAEWIELDERTHPASGPQVWTPPVASAVPATKAPGLRGGTQADAAAEASADTRAASSVEHSPSPYPTLLQPVLDAHDIRGLAEFYRQLLGLIYRHGDAPPFRGDDDADWLVLTYPDERRALAFQFDDHHVPPTWPKPGVPQQLHLDMTVPDHTALESTKERALGLGARLLQDRSTDAEEPHYVLADPAGHPFCIFVG